MTDMEVITALLSLLDQIEMEDDASLAFGRFEIMQEAGYKLVFTGEKASGRVQ